MDSTWTLGEHRIVIGFRPAEDGLLVTLDGVETHLERVLTHDPHEIVLRHGERTIRAFVAADGDERWLHFEGRTYHFTAERASGRSGAGVGEGDLTSPMPGKVIEVRVSEGQAVTAGQSLMVIEAMKMEYDISAPFAGQVTHVHFAAGEMVDAGATLVELHAGSENEL